MSDFGAIILVKKKDSSELSESEIQNISIQLEAIIENGNFTEDLKNSNYLDFREWEGEQLCIVLTEYYDDINMEEYYEATKEDDLSDAKSIADNLLLKLGEEYIITPSFENW